MRKKIVVIVGLIIGLSIIALSTIQSTSDINEDTMLVPGIDCQKMSKSYANTIPIFADEKSIKKSVMSITTDSAGIDEPKDKDSPLFKILSLIHI